MEYKLYSSIIFPNPKDVLYRFSLFLSTPFDYMPQLLNIPNHKPSQANQIYHQAIYKSNTFLANCATYQKAESLRAASLSKLDSTVNSYFIFTTKCLEFSAKWQEIFHFQNPTCAQNQLYSFHQKSVPPLYLVSTSLFRLYLFIKLLLQSALTLLSSIPQEFFSSLFLRRAIQGSVYIKSKFHTSAIQPIQDT